MNGALNGIGFDDGATALIRKQINRVRSMVPQQVVRPTPGLAQSIHVGSSEKIRLNIHLLDIEFARFDFFVDPLVTGVVASCMTGHGHKAAGFLQGHNGFGIV
jgi:hypothetical protein